MITIREIADDKSTISSTRWAFAIIIIVDVIIVMTSVLAGIVGYFIEKPIDTSFYSSVAMLLGVITGITGTTKALQGWEPNKDKKETEE